MAPYDDWIDIEEEDEDLQDATLYETKRDVILFCIDCSESMLELHDDPNNEGRKTCHLYTALEAAMLIQKRKMLVGPNDSVGILLFNTSRKGESSRKQGTETKADTFVYQPVSLLSAPKIQEIMQLLDAARRDPDELGKEFPSVSGRRVPMGDVFTSCNWVLRDGAPKTASKRVFLITDEDNPHPGPGRQQLMTSARTTLMDLVQSGVTVEPFFISSPTKAFQISAFYSSILLPNNLINEEEMTDNASFLPESISVSRIEELLAQMRFHEIPKRSLFSVPFQIGDEFVIGVKGYGLVVEQKKGAYKYFVDLGDRMEVAAVKTVYVDEDREAEIDRANIVFGSALGAIAEQTEENLDAGTRVVKLGQRPYYTAEEIRSFRTFGLEPCIKILGFKDRTELAFEDNIKHSTFLYPDEMAYSGSKRTFSALLKSMMQKKKIAICLALSRTNATPSFCALLPQEEKLDDGGWNDPPGFHMIPFPFADDIRSAPIDEACRASDSTKDAARIWIDKLSVKNGRYPPDSYPNPALAFHNAQLEASAFREEFDPETFEDLTLPNYERIHNRAGKLMKEWKNIIEKDPSSHIVTAVVGSKRKPETSVADAEIRSMYDSNTLGKLRVDQLKAFLKTKGMEVSGKKADLMQRVSDYFDAH